MIIGIGADMTDIRRIEASLARFGERFKQRCFTGTERLRSDRKPDASWSYAKRFAAKEACAKALGTGMRRNVYWRDMGVVNLASGRPTMKLTGGALAQLNSLMPDGMQPDIHVTITDDYPWAQAIVIVSAVPVADAPRGT